MKPIRYTHRSIPSAVIFAIRWYPGMKHPRIKDEFFLNHFLIPIKKLPVFPGDYLVKTMEYGWVLHRKEKFDREWKNP